MRYLMAIMTVVLLSLMLTSTAGWCADDEKKQYDFANPDLSARVAVVGADDANRLTHEFNMTQERYRLYECLALSVIVISSLATVLFFITRNKAYSATDIVNASGLILIIFGTIFLVVLTDAESQLSTGIGVMGAIAGYLFGKMQRNDTHGATSQTGADGK
jgi:hypothetical protein